MNQLIRKLSRNEDIVLLVTEINKIENDIKNYIKNNYELKWDVLQFRKFLKAKMNEELSKLPIPKLINNSILEQFEQKLDLFFTPTIGDFRSEKWKDHRLAAIFIIKSFLTEPIHQLRGYNILNKLNQINVADTINANQLILQREPLLDFEINELNKRIIFAMFGGAKNINNISLVKYKFNSNYTQYNNDNCDADHYYLQVNIKNEKDIVENNIVMDLWDLKFISYYEFLENGLLNFEEEFGLSNQNSNYERIKNKLFQNEILKNNYLLDVNYSKEKEDILNKIIAEWNQLINFDLKNKCIAELINSIWIKTINPFIEQFKSQIKGLMQMYYSCDKLKNKLRSEINNDIIEMEEYVNNPNFKYEQLFELLSTYVKENINSSN